MRIRRLPRRPLADATGSPRRSLRAQRCSRVDVERVTQWPAANHDGSTTRRHDAVTLATCDLPGGGLRPPLWPVRIHKHKQHLNSSCLCLRILADHNARSAPRQVGTGQQTRRCLPSGLCGPGVLRYEGRGPCSVKGAASCSRVVVSSCQPKAHSLTPCDRTRSPWREPAVKAPHAFGDRAGFVGEARRVALRRIGQIFVEGRLAPRAEDVLGDHIPDHA